MPESGKEPFLAILKSMRPANGLIACIAVWTGWVVAKGEPFAFRPDLLLIIVSTASILVGGNILNDINDRKIDARIHPDRPITRGRMKISMLIRSVILLWFTGLMLSAIVTWISGSIFPFLIVILAVLMLLIYEEWSKKKGLIGNLNIAVLTGLPFILGASISGDVPSIVLLFSLMAISVNITRELFKDYQDIEGDIGERITHPIRFGTGSTIITGRIFSVMGIALSLLVVIIHEFNPIYLVLILIADIIFIISILDPVNNIRRSSFLLKIGMGIALIAFFSWSII